MNRNAHTRYIVADAYYVNTKHCRDRCMSLNRHIHKPELPDRYHSSCCPNHHKELEAEGYKAMVAILHDSP